MQSIGIRKGKNLLGLRMLPRSDGIRSGLGFICDENGKMSPKLIFIPGTRRDVILVWGMVCHQLDGFFCWECRYITTCFEGWEGEALYKMFRNDGWGHFRSFTFTWRNLRTSPFSVVFKQKPTLVDMIDRPHSHATTYSVCAISTRFFPDGIPRCEQVYMCQSGDRSVMCYENAIWLDVKNMCCGFERKLKQWINQFGKIITFHCLFRFATNRNWWYQKCRKK